jgi:hypothetical protein
VVALERARCPIAAEGLVHGMQIGRFAFSRRVQLSVRHGFHAFQELPRPAGSRLCAVLNVSEKSMTLDPTRVSCERCLALLGRLRGGNLGLPGRRSRSPPSDARAVRDARGAGRSSRCSSDVAPEVVAAIGPATRIPPGFNRDGTLNPRRNTSRVERRRRDSHLSKHIAPALQRFLRRYRGGAPTKHPAAGTVVGQSSVAIMVCRRSRGGDLGREDHGQARP